MNSYHKVGAMIVALSTAAGIASADQVFFQGFESDTAGWFDNDDYAGYGSVTAVASGTGGVTSFTGSQHAVFEQSAGSGGSAAFTRFDGYRDTWSGGMTARASVYMDTNWAAGEGFDYSVAAYDQSGSHLQDFIFHVTKDTSSGDLLVGGSNNTNFDPREDIETLNHYSIGTSGWFTLEHDFRDFGDGTLAVDLNLYDASGTLVFTETRHTAGNVLATVVGGNGYGWFTNIDIAGGINVDDVSLTVVPLPPAMLAGMGMLAGIAGVRKVRRGK